MDEFNEYTLAHEPEKKFMLISQLEDGHQMVTWHETLKDLEFTAKYNKAATPVEALEICTCKEISVEELIK